MGTFVTTPSTTLFTDKSSAPGIVRPGSWTTSNVLTASEINAVRDATYDLRTQAGAVFNVKSYGAVGDGVTDDATAINLALMAASTAGGGTVFIPGGTYIVGAKLNLSVTAPVWLVGAGVNATTVKLKNSANTDVISHSNFSTLTGGSTAGGVFRVAVKDLTVDGNKANNSSGYGIRLYGKGFLIDNVAIQNCKNDGLYTEYGGADNFTVTTGKLEATYVNLQCHLNDGAGWKNKGPHDSVAIGFVSYSNGTWGWDNQTPMHAVNVNTYLNPSGGIWVHGDGAIGGTDILGTTDTGYGLLIDSGTGGTHIAGGNFSGPTGVEIRSPNHYVSGVVANTTTAGVKLNGGSAHLSLTMFSNSGYWFDVGSQNGGSNVTVQGLSGTGTLFNGTPSGMWQISGTQTYARLASASLDSPNGWTPILPPSNQIMSVIGKNAAATIGGAGGTVTVGAYLGALQEITIVGNGNFTINTPTTPVGSGQSITIRIKNTSGGGGAVGVITWGAGYKMGAAWTSPADAFSRSITFQYDGTNWIEVSRTAADVAN